MRDLSRALRWRLLAAVVLMAAFSLTEGMGVLLLLPILQVAGLDLGAAGQATHWAKSIEIVLHRCGISPNLLLLLLLFVALMSARSFLRNIEQVFIYDAEQDFMLMLRRRLYAVIIRADWPFLCRFRSADLTHAITAQVERVGGATMNLLFLCADLTLAAIYGVLALELSAPMVLVVLIASALLAFILRDKLRVLRDKGWDVSDANQQLYRTVLEHVESLKVAKTYDAEGRNYDRFSSLCEGLAMTRRQALAAQVSAGWWFESGSVLVLGGLVYLWVRGLNLAAPEILILLLIFSRIMPRLTTCHENYRAFVGTLPSYAAIRDLEQQCERVAESGTVDGDELPLQDCLALVGVTFSYGRNSEPVLHDVDLRIEAGSIVAIVGPSGAGKSTLGDLMMGLLAPATGLVLVDDKELGPASRGLWRRQVGYISQETFLFPDSIRANLLWARPEATQAEIWQALKLAAAEDFVRRLPEGLDTIVGERGILFSHGERQRVALARALLRKPTLLVLDEATNSLDPATETRVMEAIERLRGAVTVVVITHRQAAVRGVDRIYVLEAGKIVEAGDWNTLILREDSRLRSLCGMGAMEF